MIVQELSDNEVVKVVYDLITLSRDLELCHVTKTACLQVFLFWSLITVPCFCVWPGKLSARPCGSSGHV